MLNPDFELQLLADGYDTIVGIDEVGRGCWAGPVAIGVYFYHAQTPHLPGINDSKLLSAKQRGSIAAILKAHDHLVSYGTIADINNFGVGKTIERLIQQVVDEHTSDKTLFLIDGQFKAKFGGNVRKFIRGDSTYYSIAAASILAKVARDQLMTQLDQDFPLYGFAKHKGYGTKQHQLALTTHGICDLHRLSYKNIAALAAELVAN